MKSQDYSRFLEGERLASLLATQARPLVDDNSVGWFEELEIQGEWELLLGGACWALLASGRDLPIELIDFSDPFDVASDQVSTAIKEHFAERGITA